MALASATTDARAYANSAVSAAQAAQTDADFAAASMANLGMTVAVIGQDAYDALLPAYTNYLASVGVENRGVVVVQLATIVAGLTTDATYGTAAKNLVAAYSSALAYSTDVTSTLDKIISVIPAPLALTLTTGVDAIDGTKGDDTFTSGSGTIQAADVLSDTSGTDQDTLNILLSSDAIQFTANNIETINVTSNNLSGLNTTVDATKIAGNTTITMLAGKSVDGIAEVLAAGNNNVTAGAGISDLRVTDVNKATIDAGAAAYVTVDDTAALTNAITVTANGNLDLTATNGAATDSLVIKATKASVVNLNAASTLVGVVTVTGDNDVTLDSGDELTALTVTDATAARTVKVDVDVAGAVDASKWTVDSIIVSADIGATVTAGSAQTYDVTKAQTALVINSSAATNAALTVNTGVSSTSLTLDTGTSKVATVNVTAAATVGTLDTAATGKLTVNGSSTLTIGQTNAGTLNMSAYTGNTTVTSDAASSIELGSGTNKLTLGDFAYLVSGGAGADTIDATATAAAAITSVFATNGGDDTLKINTPGTGTITFNGGDGTDTLWLKASATTAGATALVLKNVEVIEVENQTAGADTTGVTLVGADITKQVLTIKTSDSIDTVTVDVTAGTTTTDLSGITLSNIDTFNINGGASAQTIIGTSGNDKITGGPAADILTGGAGSDTFIIAATTDSVAATMDKITDFTVASDKLDLPDTTRVANNTTGVNVGTSAGASAADVVATVSNGVMSLTGLASKLAMFDTLAEWISAATATATATATTVDVIAFAYNGNTYVLSTDVGDAVDVVVELTGLVGVTALGTTAAANTIVLS